MKLAIDSLADSTVLLKLTSRRFLRLCFIGVAGHV
jgi:hypothetical protein